MSLRLQGLDTMQGSNMNAIYGKAASIDTAKQAWRHMLLDVCAYCPCRYLGARQTTFPDAAPLCYCSVCAWRMASKYHTASCASAPEQRRRSDWRESCCCCIFASIY